jgi:hypothetical protein
VHHAVPRLTPDSPIARLGLAAAASIIVVADLIVLVGPAAPAPDQPSPAGPTAVTSVEPSVTASPPRAPTATAATPAPTHAPAPAQRATPTTRPMQPPAARRTHSPFEQRCRDGEIPAWLCRDLPTDRYHG